MGSAARNYRERCAGGSCNLYVARVSPQPTGVVAGCEAHDRSSSRLRGSTLCYQHLDSARIADSTLLRDLSLRNIALSQVAVSGTLSCPIWNSGPSEAASTFVTYSGDPAVHAFFHRLYL